MIPDEAVEARMSKSHWWHFGIAVFMVLMYALNLASTDRIVWLFAAAFAVTHGAAEKVINYIKADRKDNK